MCRLSMKMLLDGKIFCGYIKTMMGRPKKPKGQQRENVLRVRLTEDERERLDAAATAAALDTSTWARTTLLSVATKGPRQKG